jgi:hypothetical protein
MVRLESVADAGEVRVAGPVLVQDLVKAVFQSSKAQGRTSLVSFGGVVAYHVKDDFDDGTMQFLHHGPKLIQADLRVAACTVGQMGSEKRHWAVARVITETREGILSVELEDGQELDRCDTQCLKIRNLIDDSEIGASPYRSDTGIRIARKPRDMHLIDDCPAERPPEGRIRFPIERSEIHHDTFHRGGCVIPRLRGIGSIIVPTDRNALTVGIEEDFVTVKTMSGGWIIRSVDAVPVELSRLDSGDEDVSVMRCAMENRIETNEA